MCGKKLGLSKQPRVGMAIYCETRLLPSHKVASLMPCGKASRKWRLVCGVLAGCLLSAPRGGSTELKLCIFFFRKQNFFLEMFVGKGAIKRAGTPY